MSITTPKKSALIIATINSFITPFMGSSVNIALPAIEKEFHVDAVLLSWIATSYLLAVTISLVPFGRAADIYGRKKIFTSGIILFTLSSILCAISISTPMLLMFRILQGIGNAMVFATDSLDMPRYAALLEVGSDDSPPFSTIAQCLALVR